MNKVSNNIPSNSKRTFARKIMVIMDGSFLTRDAILNNVMFLLFAFIISLLYVGNSHYAEKVIINTHKTTSDLKDLRSEFISVRSELMFISKQSEVARLVADQGIYESTIPPGKIVLNKNDYAIEN